MLESARLHAVRARFAAVVGFKRVAPEAAERALRLSYSALAICDLSAVDWPRSPALAAERQCVAARRS